MISVWDELGKLHASGRKSTNAPKWNSNGRTWWFESEGSLSMNVKNSLYGWVELSHLGVNRGKYLAQCPTPYDAETDSDATDQVAFDTLEKAQSWVEANHNGYII